MTMYMKRNAAGSSAPQVMFDVSSATISIGAVCIGTVTSVSGTNVEHLQGDISITQEYFTIGGRSFVNLGRKEPPMGNLSAVSS
jgi:hypothetical protein